MDITAAVTSGPDTGFELRAVSIGEPRADEVLVEVKAVGVCHTDLLCADGVFPVATPAVLGHEGAGVVVEVGSGVTWFAPGDRVVMSFDSCGLCRNCRRGVPAYCDVFFALNFGGGRSDGTTALLDGDHAVHSHFFGQSSLATHAIVRARTLVKLPDDIPFDVAAPLGCGVQTGAGAAMNVLEIEPGSTVAVTGAGSVGLGAVMGARLASAGTVIIIDPIAARRALGLDVGADVAIDPLADDFAEKLAAVGGLDYAIDSSGQPAVIEACFGALNKRGKLATIAGPAAPTYSFDAFALLDGRSVCGLTMGESVPQHFIPVLIDHWRAGRFPLDKIVSTYPMADLDKALSAMRNHEIIKPVLTT